MTTGRINQVTILNPGAEARRHTPIKRAEGTKEESRRSGPQSPTAKLDVPLTLRAIDSIAPTEFLKVRSATEA